MPPWPCSPTAGPWDEEFTARVVEIAAVLDCAEGTVKVHLHRARRALAAVLGCSDEAGRDEAGREELDR